MGENIKVSVRVRPFNDREKTRGASLVVRMDANSTYLLDPANSKSEPRKYTFDHSYWSHDSFVYNEEGYCEPSTPKYADQSRIFKDLGEDLLNNAWQGYNCSLFAYGQTGSGKSYTIMGHGANKGLVPRTCETLFHQINDRHQPGVQYEVTFSMVEIYNEQVRDLLNKHKTPKGGLKVKEKPQKGFYVEGLTVTPVGSFDEIRLRMNEGDRQRTIAATKMNNTSSRAHTIVALNFAQTNIARKITKFSTINLVDLAGSERVKQTEATGDRFEEAKNINKSLLTLGNVIKGLCDKTKGVKSQVPFRESMLTRLLKNALGGNSKTCMVAAIGPDAENYEQTLSTLRYADRAKSIRTAAQVNKTATDQLILELIDEKERLLKELRNAKVGQVGISEEDLQLIKQEQEEEIRRYKEQMQDIEKAWQERLEAAQEELQVMMEKERRAKEEEKNIPHFSNLNEDPALVGKVHHMLKPGMYLMECSAHQLYTHIHMQALQHRDSTGLVKFSVGSAGDRLCIGKTILGQTSIGNGKEKSQPEIVLNGPRITKDHATVTNREGKVHLKPRHGLVLHNGQEVTKEIKLHHQDRIRFGSNNLFVFFHPEQAEKLRRKGKKLPEITYEYAWGEIAKHSGLNLEEEDCVLQEEVMSVMQLVQDVNAMAEDLEHQVEFTILLVSAEARGLESGGRTEVYVSMRDMNNGNEYLWERNKFLNRQSHIQEMYHQFEESGELPQMDQSDDPFWEPPDTPVIVGVVSVPLRFLSHMLDFQDEPLTVIDYKARQAGFLRVDLLPCDAKGRDDVDLCIKDPMDLVNSPVYFKIKVHQAMNLPERFEKTWCRYRFYKDSEYITTDVVKGSNPKYNQERLFCFTKQQVDHKFVDYLRERSLAIEIWGKQADSTDGLGTLGSTSSKTRKSQEERKKLSDDLQLWKEKAKTLQDKMMKIKGIIGPKPTDPTLCEIHAVIDA